MFYLVTTFLLVLSFPAIFDYEISGQSATLLKDPNNGDLKSFAPKAESVEPSAISGSITVSAAERRQQAISLNNEAAELAASGNYADALPALQGGITADGTFVNPYVNLSVVYDHLERYDDALMAAYSALNVDPNWRPARIQICQLMISLDRPGEAVKCYDGLGSLEGDDPLVRRGYAEALLRASRWDAAMAVFGRLLQTDPDDPRLHCGLGYSQYHRKKLKDALASFQRALEIDPKIRSAHFNLAIVLLAMKRRPEALEQYQYLRTSDPELAEQLYKSIYADKLLVVGQTEKKEKE